VSSGLLLDTHVVLWWLTDDPTLSEEVKIRLDDEPDVSVSSATLWEVAIKQSIGELAEPEDLTDRIAQSGFRQLAISFEHAIAAGRLPLLHRDPFDRLLVAQARCDGLTLVTRDPQVQRYDVDLLPV
jgi:PIN domain nuclease of toxin-antitoxin system